jgi:glycosyltransferase involved in cell wall biosynthesis
VHDNAAEVSSLISIRSHSASSKRRNICVVTETYPPEINGVALTVSQLVSGLIGRGHSVSVVRPFQRESGRFERSLSANATLVRGLPLPGYRGLQFGIPAARRLRRAWWPRQPDAIYVATEGPLGWSAIRAARRLKIPIVSGFHTNYHNYCYHYRVGWLQDAALRYLRWFHNQTDSTLVSSEDLRERLQADGFCNVKVLDRGVDSQLFSPRWRSAELRHKWRVADETPVLIYVGRVAAEKNLEVAIAAYRAMQRINSEIKFVVVGDGPLRLSLEREHPEVIFAGTQQGEQLAQHYASADIFLFASETETFGNVTLEAMASGLGVIAYNYAGAKVHISDGETGVLVPYRDAQAFVESACRLLREPRLLCRMRQQARRHVISLAWPRVVERFETLLLSARNLNKAGASTSIASTDMAV